MANNIKNRWHKFARQATGVVALLGLLLGVNQAFAQASVAVNAPPTAVGGDMITFQVSMSSNIQYSDATYSVALDSSLMNVSATCGTNASDQGTCTAPSIGGSTTVSGTIPNLTAGQQVMIVITAKVPTFSEYTGYANPPSISTIATLTPPGGSPRTSQGNTAITYKPYTIKMTPNIVSPAATFAFDTDTITFENVYENTNPNPGGGAGTDQGGPADGLLIQGAIYTRNTVGLAYSPWGLTDVQYTCTASGGAQCPTVPLQSGGDTWYGATAMYLDRVPVFPIGGKIVVTSSFKITKPQQTTLCDGSYQGVIANNIRIGSSFNTDERISSDSVPAQQLKTAQIALPPCPLTDLEVVRVQVPPSLALGTNTVIIKYRNNGPAAVNAQLNDFFGGGLSGLFPHIVDSSIQYQLTSVQCIDNSAGVNCPDANGVVNNWPSGGELSIVSTFTLTQIAPAQCGIGDFMGRVIVEPSLYFAAPGIDPVTGLTFMDPVPSNNSISASPELHLPRPACAVQDLGAQINSMPTALKFGTPYVVNFSISNYGAGDFVWSPASTSGGPLSLDMQVDYSARVQFANATLTCTPSGAAMCPTITMPAYYQSPFVLGGSTNNLGGQMGMNNAFSIPAGGSLTFVLTLMPTTYAPGCVNGTSGKSNVSVSVDNYTQGVLEPQPDPHANYDTKAVPTAPVCEDLTVNKQMMVNGAQANAVNVGGDLSFVLSATAPSASQGGVNISSVLIEDVLPAGFEFSTTTPGQLACVINPASGTTDAVSQCATLANGGIAWDAASRKLSINTPVLAAGSSVVYTVLGKAEDRAGVWNNVAKLSFSSDDFIDVNLSSNTSNVEFTINGTEPTVLKSTSDPIIAYAGAPVRYNISVSNPPNGNGVANATLTDVLPAGFTLESVGAPVLTGAATYSATQAPQVGAATLDWGVFTLPPGTSVSVDFVAKSSSSLTCSATAIINNSATLNYANGSTALSATYDGAAAGHTRDDVSFPCAPSQVGGLSMHMIVTGEALPTGFAPTAGVFAICTDPANSVQTRYPASGSATISAASIPVQFDNIAVNSQCLVQEDPAMPISTPPAGYHWKNVAATFATNPTTIVGGQIVVSAVQWELVRDVADVVVSFSATGAPTGYAGALAVSAICDIPAAGTAYPATGTINATPQNPAVISGVPVGANCSITTGPLPSAPTDFTWSSTAATVNPPIVVVAATGGRALAFAQMVYEPVTPGLVSGSLTVRFAPTGLPAGYNPTVQVYALCDLPGANTRYPTTGTTGVAAQGNSALAGIPVNAQCSVVVDGPQLPAAPAGYQWQSVTPGVMQPGAMVATGVSATVTWVLVATTTGPDGVQPVPVNQWQALALMSLALLAFAAVSRRNWQHRK